jgi:hypothetical protein
MLLMINLGLKGHNYSVHWMYDGYPFRFLCGLHELRHGSVFYFYVNPLSVPMNVTFSFDCAGAMTWLSSQDSHFLAAIIFSGQ